MVLYSTEAKIALVGDAGVLSFVILSFGYLNEAFLNSGCAVTARLIYREEVTSSWHAQDGCGSVDWNWLKNDTTVATKRGNVGADLVSYLTTDNGCSEAGYATIFGTHSVVNLNHRVFAHEVAHNFGCRHNTENDQTGATGYAHGFYVNVGGIRYGTIMSYIADVSIPFFSNPDVSWMDYALGDSTDADNHRTINENRGTVAAFKTIQIARLESPRFTSSTSFAFDLAGPTSVAGTYTVEITDNYAGASAVWTTLTTVSFSGGPTATISDNTILTTTAQRYYRVKKAGVALCGQVGFYRKNIPAGYSMIANSLDAVDNRISNVISNPEDGMTMYKWDSGVQDWVTSDYLFSSWGEPNLSLGPGEGAVLYSPSARQLSFVGFVWPGFDSNLGYGWLILSSPVPQQVYCTQT
jgi:hypothetical protein